MISHAHLTLPRALTLAGALLLCQAAPLWAQEDKAAEKTPEPVLTDQDKKEQKGELLDVLFQQLKKADSNEAAELIEKGVWKLWIDSGSPTIDLSMTRVAKALEAKDLPLALDLLNGIVKVKPDYAEGWNKRATVLFMLKDFTHSIQDIERALALEPRHFGALSGLGLIFLEIDNKEAALRAFRKALEVHPYLENARKQEERLSEELEGRGI